ncbi:unnamed protein product [Heterobilharzia americana]|nr:unnamed protein product [Heterobilharzia americana]
MRIMCVYICATDFGSEPYHLGSPTTGSSCPANRPQPPSLHRPTWLKPTVRDFIHWCHVLVWPPRAFFQPGPTSANIV